MRILAALLLCGPALLPAQHRLFDPADLPARSAAARELGDLLRTKADLPTTVALAASAGQQLPPGSSARARLQAALVAANTSEPAPAALRDLRSALGDLVDNLTFEPVRQAGLPRGFPDFQAVDEVELRHYPVYRMVRTGMQGGSNGAFWPLFRHIESNGIAMTTPVQMDWEKRAGEDRERPVVMAFLYGDPGMEPKSTDAGVEVVEMAAQTVLSIGAIGDDRRDTVEALRARLEAWLANAAGTWEAAGPLRTMGYNSPMVARDRRYFEVQLPVRKVRAEQGSVVR